MNIGGFQTLTLSDFPGRVAAIVFTQGCNFRCPFCHNGSLLPMRCDPAALYPSREVLRRLGQRRTFLDGVVISGGEPTLQEDLPPFIAEIKTLGLQVKLDTNGSRPEVLGELFEAHLVDFVAMDIKAPWTHYDRLAGVAVPTRAIRTSMELILESGVPHEFRTTVVLSLLSPADLEEIQSQLPLGSPYRLQEFQPQNALDPSLALRALATICSDQSVCSSHSRSEATLTGR